MTLEETEKKGGELIIKLNEKFDKCKWEKIDGSVPKSFSLKFVSGEIIMGMKRILVYNKGICALEYEPKNNNEASTLAIMWAKAGEKIQAPIDAYVKTIIDELDKL